MDFIAYANDWARSELFQGKIMIGIGVLILIAYIAIWNNGNELLGGSLIPLTLLLIVLFAYGTYVLYSRPANVNQSIILYEKSKQNAIKQEIAKHTNDNKAGKTLLRIYPILAVLSMVALIFISSTHYKG